MALNEQYDSVTWTPTHYVYVEKVGPFSETAPKAWPEALQLRADLTKDNQVTGAFSMYNVAKQIYRAGFSIGAPPKNLPDGLKYTLVDGRQYLRFVLTGSYSQLPEACGRVFEIVSKEGIQSEDEFCLENYVNDPQTTSEDQLVTEILVPAAKVGSANR